MQSYLDNSATTAPRPEVLAAMQESLTARFGNPSSLHNLGVQAERLVKEARAAVARLVRGDPAGIVFTSGGTEAINLAIKGSARAQGRRRGHLITSQAEHPAVLASCQALAAEGFDVTYLPVAPDGQVTPAAVEAALRPETFLVSLMYVNNEVGSVNPVAEVGALLRERRVLFHVDAVQAEQLPLDVRALGCDLLSLSAHKLHGPKGVGALWVRRGLKLEPLLHGGGQEGGLRSGTENVPGIAGFGVAANLAQREQPAARERLGALKASLLAGLAEAGLSYTVTAPPREAGAPHILNLSFAGISRGEVLVHALEEHGVYVSTGSACHSRKPGSSHVLAALGLPAARAGGAIRVSLSLTSAAEVNAFLAAARQVVPRLAALSI